MSSAEFTLDDFEFDGRHFSMEVEYEWEQANDGIGSYEYWGAKGNDKGHDYAEVCGWGISNLVENTEDTPIDIPESDPLFKKIHSAIEGKVLSHAESIEVDSSDDEPEYEPPEPDYD